MTTTEPAIKYPKQRTKFVEVTPELAATWLESVPAFQREVRDQRVARYVRDMRNGKWTSSSDHIAFDRYGQLINGQHRLRAIVESGMTFTMGVDYGLDDDAFGNTDTGYGRTFAQQLGGIKYGTMLGSATRIIMAYEADGEPRNKNHRQLWTNAEVRDYVLENQIALEFAAAAAFRIAKAVGGIVSSWLAFIYLTDKVSEKYSWEFYNSVLEGADLTAGDPRLTLRNLLSKRVRAEAMANPGLQLGIMIKAWNDWMVGNTRQILSLKDGEDFPVLAKRRKRQSSEGSVVNAEDE